jgi:hypothetical protein
MLIAESAALLPEFRQRLAHAFPAAHISDMGQPGEFFIAFPNNSRVYAEYYGSSLQDIGWEEDEIACIQKVFPTIHHVYSLAYRGIEAAKEVVVHLADSNQMMVDNDCGTLVLGADFVRKVINEPAWYWFDDLQQHDQ